MKTQCQQCPKCYSVEMPDSIYCSKCAHRLQQSTIKVNSLTPRQIIIISACIVPVVLLVMLAGAIEGIKSKKTALSSAPDVVSTATALTAQPVSDVAFSNAQTIEGKVVGVHDGDTCTVLDQNKQQHKIRFAGIDAPELGQDYGTKSKENLSSLIFGKTVRVVTNKTDKYGRTVGTVFLGGRDINLEQVKTGFAWHYKDYQNEQSETDRKLYSDAETKAKADKTGLWAAAKPVAPWDFRHGNAIDPKLAGKIIGNKNSFIYHWAGCPGFTKTSEKNRVVFDSVEAAEAEGYRAAKNCSKPAPKSKPEIEDLEETDGLEANVEPENNETTTYVPVPVPRTYVPAATPEAVREAASRPETPSYRASEPETAEPSARSSTATAVCADGTLSYSANRRGTCSHHGGVSEWLDGNSNDSTPGYSPSFTPSDSGRPKTVQVRGYYRKDGTYVRPHTRSAPRRKH